MPGKTEPETQLAHSASSQLGLTWILGWVILSALAFHAAYAWPQTGLLAGVYLFALVLLAKTDTWRKAFYSGLAVGMLIAMARLEFFWTIFSAGAIALWLVYAFWIGLFVALARLCLKRFGGFGWVTIPFVWCGLEYFRSELYFLRFSWLTPGFAFGLMPQQVPLHQLGAYGLSFLLMSLACLAAWEWSRAKLRAAVVVVFGLCVIGLWGLAAQPKLETTPLASLRILRVQMEFPTEKEVLVRLNEAIRRHPDSELLVLSEYTFTEPLPQSVRNWCRQNRRYLIVGAKDPAPDGKFYNTAFVISPEGEIVFRQVKAVPIQFFSDGLPAPEEKPWPSPWGKMGLCICYDLSYRRVTDQLIRMGAQALIVPTMDVVDWGRRQHELHGRVAPVRAAEYGVPIFRLASSGISQFIDSKGQVLACTPFAADGTIMAGLLEIREAGHIPVDQWLAPFSTGLTALLLILLGFSQSPGDLVPKGRLSGSSGSPVPPGLLALNCVSLNAEALGYSQASLQDAFPILLPLGETPPVPNFRAAS